MKLDKFSNPYIVSNFEVDFENINEIEKDNFKISEISATEKVVNDLQNDLLQSQLKYEGVAIEYEGKAMAWGGLRDEKVKAWTELPTNERASIETLASGVTALTKTVNCQ